MRTSTSSRSLGAVIAIGASALAMAGCAPTAAIEPPIRWAEGTRLVYEDREASLPEGVAAVGALSIELRDAGRGVVEGIPRGELSERPDGTICVETAGGLYAGEVRWRATSEWGIELDYDGGGLLIQSAPGRFAEDWSELRIFPCGVEAAYWRVGISCGSLGSPGDEQLGLRRCDERA